MADALEQVESNSARTWSAAPGAHIIAGIYAGLLAVLVAVEAIMGETLIRQFAGGRADGPTLLDWIGLGLLGSTNVALAGYAIYHYLQGRNSTLTLTRDGFVLRNWRGRETSVLWNRVARVRYASRDSMAVIFVDMRGPEARIRAARGDREMVRDLRDRMLAHLDAEEVEARSPFWTAWEWLWWEAR